jgi:ligand-binding sensor domain-containing protein
MCKGGFLAWALALAGVHACAQRSAFLQYTPKDGLAQSQVRCITQDVDGFLWFGTLGGASRFDGHIFTNYSSQDGLPDPQVNAVLSAADSTLWLASGRRLMQLNGSRLSKARHWGEVPGDRIQALAEGRRGEIFIGSDGGGVARVQGDLLATLPHYPMDSAAHVRALLVLPNGDLLIGHEQGALRWNGSRYEHLPIPYSISSVALGHDGSLWFGTFRDGLVRLLPNGSVRTFTEEDGALHGTIRHVLVDEEGRVWASSKFGLNMLDGERWRAITARQGLPNDNIYCAFQDSEGVLWFGTDGGGMLRYAGDRFVSFTTWDGLCSDQIMCLVPANDGALWLGTYGYGVCRKDAMAMVSTLDGFPSNTVWCGLPEPDGSLLFGTSDGLSRLRNGLVEALPALDTLTSRRILSLYRTRTGELWCGTSAGAARIHVARGAQLFFDSAGAPSRTVRTLIESSDGTLFMGSDQGVTTYADGIFKNYGMLQGLAASTVFCSAADDAGQLWFGTANGLSCWRNGSFTTVRLGRDFGSNYVNLLLLDDEGYLWAGTNNGLYRFRPRDVLQDPSRADHYTDQDGLPSLEFNLNAGYKDAKGCLWFGSAAGLVMHDPNNGPRPRAARAPYVHITGLRSFLQLTDWSPHAEAIDLRSGLPINLSLPYGRQHLTFDYAGISLADPWRVRYRYRLVGLDADWLPPTEPRFASYSNLPHGEYVFEVMAAGKNGVWSAPVRFPFRIRPPFWLTWWFFALMAMAAGLAVFGVMRGRAIMRQRKERTRQLVLRSRMLQLEQQALNANMNRHFIFNALNSIQYYINRQDKLAANRYLTSFAKLIRKNLDASQSDTTSLANELERLQLYLVLEQMRFKEKFDYRIEVDQTVDTTQVELPAMMLQPYVENSIWHGILPMERTGRVTIEIRPGTVGYVSVRIADDGIGLEASLASKEADEDHISRGIEITKGRADVLRRLNISDIRISGPRQITAQTGAGAGTEVLIDLPWHTNNGVSQGVLQSA